MLLKDSYEQLELAVNRLTAELRHTTQSFIAPSPGEFIAGAPGVDLAISAINNLWYSDFAVSGRETEVCIGAIGVDEYVMQLARDVNLCKVRFKSAIQIVQDRVVGRGKSAPSRAWKSKATRNMLSEIGLGRLSLRLCNRHIPLLDYQPHTIGFSYSSGGKSIKKMTAQKVLDELKATGYESDQAQADFNTINDLPKSLLLARVTPLAGYYKANIFQQRSQFTKTIAVFLPILFLNEGAEPVNHTLALPSGWNKTSRNPRSDRKISSEPLIKTLPIYQYDK